MVGGGRGWGVADEKRVSEEERKMMRGREKKMEKKIGNLG